MRVLSLPAKVRALVLDFDSTLYTNPVYASFQNDVLIERLARERGESFDAMKAKIGKLREKRVAAGEGATSLGNLFRDFGIDIPTSVRWREELIDPGRWLSKDPALDEALTLLARRFVLGLVTNNPASVGRKGLAALGVEDRFACVVGLDDTGQSKPDPAPFGLVSERLGVPPEECVSIGDRYDVDLAPALALGMGAILVEGVEDVRTLPAYFETALPPAKPRG
jgi:phosphoglycolate phosphatase/putative hydrolase of the HAD superfamily